MPDNGELLRLREVAERLHVSESYVKSLVYSARLASVKLAPTARAPRRVRVADLDAYVAASTEESLWMERR